MVVGHGWLIDTSAYTRLERSDDAEQWLVRIDRGLIHISSVTLLELGFSARSGADWRREMAGPPVSQFVIENLTPASESRAQAVQGVLADRGHHRAVKIPDLLIAAIAELAGLTVLHLDKDFELIAQITGQPTERLTGTF